MPYCFYAYWVTFSAKETQPLFFLLCPTCPMYVSLLPSFCFICHSHDDDDRHDHCAHRHHPPLSLSACLLVACVVSSLSCSSSAFASVIHFYLTHTYTDLQPFVRCFTISSPFHGHFFFHLYIYLHLIFPLVDDSAYSPLYPYASQTTLERKASERNKNFNSRAWPMAYYDFLIRRLQMMPPRLSLETISVQKNIVAPVHLHT